MPPSPLLGLGRRRSRAPRVDPRDLPLRLIDRHAPGRSFFDVGCMWKIHGGYAFHAADAGATRVVGVDVMAATPEFLARNAARTPPIEFHPGDVNDPTLPDRIGTAEVVFCGGVLYHMPNPVQTLERLRALCTGTLILSSMTIPERDVPQSAIYVPFLPPAERERLAVTVAGPRKIGLDTEFDAKVDYSNWFWLLTPSAIAAMLRTAGFTVAEQHVFRHAACFVCAAA